MKKIILSAFVLSMAVAVQAQEIPERKSEKPGMMYKKRQHQGMDMKALNLSEEQKAKFKIENEAFRLQREELKKNDNITVKEWKAKSESIRKAHKEKIQSILTTEQKTKLETMRKEGKARHEGMRAKMGDRMKSGNRGERMKTELGLSAEQSAKLETNHKAMVEQMKTIRENSKLSDEQKKEQMKELHKKQKENLKSILTAEQLQKLKDQRPARDGMRKKPAGEKTI